MIPFLDPEMADEQGLVGLGGVLSPGLLVHAYRRGIFPWYEEGGPILWWSPDPRGILPLDGLHVSRRLARTLRSGKFRCTLDHAFEAVLFGCADRIEGTWLTEELAETYRGLHGLGLAHSVEAWEGPELAGGLFGVALGGFFAAESMFTHRSEGSKAALVFAVEHLRRCGFRLLDIQMVSPHTRRFGAVEIPRREYLRRLTAALRMRVRFSSEPFSDTFLLGSRS